MCFWVAIKIPIARRRSSFDAGLVEITNRERTKQIYKMRYFLEISILINVGLKNFEDELRLDLASSLLFLDVKNA